MLLRQSDKSTVGYLPYFAHHRDRLLYLDSHITITESLVSFMSSFALMLILLPTYKHYFAAPPAISLC